MVVVVARLEADERKRAPLEARFLARPRLVDRHAGFRRLQFLRARGRGEYLLVLEWDDMETFRAYAKSADFDHAHGDLDEGVRPGGLAVYDVVLDSLRGG